MSDTEEKSDKSSDECEEAIRQFAEVAECDEAYAHSILQDFDYDLDRALTHFFANQEAGSDDEKKSSSAPEAKRPRRQEEFPLELSLMTWNVDGIDKGNLQKRFTAVLYIIAKANPEIIFLQEMVGELLPNLMDLMEKMYHIYISNAELPYFCVTLVSKNINVVKNEVINFENTAMGRSMIVVEAEWERLKLKLINTHLESMAEYSEKRKAQFSSCMKKLEALVAENPSETLAIFAGDLNIRDSEISTLPTGVKDAWVMAGSDNENKFTWDMRRNDNKQASGARMRFDRVFYKGPYADVNFSLQGTQRIRGIHCFPSDHFAVVCRFSDPKE